MTKKFRVNHIVLCEVATYRVVEADTFEDALAKVAEIETYTASGCLSCDYEIISDLAVKEMKITEFAEQ